MIDSCGDAIAGFFLDSDRVGRLILFNSQPQAY
jgi:hypothetical protein